MVKPLPTRNGDNHEAVKILLVELWMDCPSLPYRQMVRQSALNRQLLVRLQLGQLQKFSKIKKDHEKQSAQEGNIREQIFKALRLLGEKQPQGVDVLEETQP